jgi:Family of unknown function (DUF6519)
MPSDKTRTSDDIRQGYKGPVFQQGRVILDRDLNALDETLSGAIEADALDIIGPCGTPDDGFAISIPGISSPPDPGLWVPPAPLGAPAPHPFDFLISPGTMYVGGQRAVFPAADPGQQPFTYSYFDQPDWIQPDDPSGGSPPVSPQIEFIYLHLFEQEVGAVEDSDLKDVALGGPDTTQRLRLMRRVERLQVVAGDCASALTQAQGVWLGRGLQFDTPTMRLLPQAALQVGFTQSATAADPCDPVATGGYLGADNQLIRVQISDAGDGTAGSGKLLWGYDNASFLYRVTVNSDSKTLQLNQSPVDAFHAPQAEQVVEVLRTAAVLESDPDASDPFHQETIVRCIAEASGEVRTLVTGYDPGAGTVVLDQVLPAEYLDGATPVFLRIWQAELGFDPAGGTVQLADAGGVTTGVQVTITIPTNGTPPVGAYWMIAVRPSTPQAVYPERFLLSPQPPDGPRQWACPLAVVDWTKALSYSPPGDQPAVQDCREKFDNLVELTKRKLGGCCTVQIFPQDVRKSGGLQAIIDRAVSGGVPATICFTPGVYSLPEPLRFDARHSHLKLEGCQEGVILQAAQGAESKFLDGLVVLSQSDNVTVQGLAFNLPPVPFLAASGRLAGLNPKLLLEIRGPSLTGLSVSIGIHPLKCNDLTVRHCKFTYPSFASGSPEAGSVNGFAVGILSGGGCVGLAIEENDFEGAPQLNASFSEEPFQFLIGYALTPVSTIFGAKGPRRKITSQDVFNTYGDAVLGAMGTGLSGLIAKPALAAAKRKSTSKRSKAKAKATSAAARTIDLSAFFGFTLNGNGTFLPAWLQDASFRANKFSDLTLGILIIGETGSLRIQDNEVVDSYAGIWLFPRRSPLPAPSSKSQPELEEIVQDPVIVIGTAIARGYPLPDQFSDPSQVNVALNLPLVLRRPLARSFLPAPLDAYNILSGTIEPSLESEAAQATSSSTAQGFNFSLQCSGNSIDGQVAGTGRGSSNEVDIYDPATDSWTVGTPFATPRRNFPTDTDGTSIWLAGGYAPTEPTASMEIFDGNANSWSAGPDMPSAGVGLVGFFIGSSELTTGDFDAMGGRSSDVAGSDFTNPFDYNLSANTWATRGATYPDNQVNNMACGILSDSKGGIYIYCVGGSAGGQTTATDRVFRYNLAADVMESIAAPWPGNSDGITLPGGFAVLNNKLYILGGFRINTGVIDTIWEFTPRGNIWEQKEARLPVPLGFIPTAAIGGSIYTAGGSTWDGTTIQDSTSSFRYDPSTDFISQIAPIPRPTSETRALNFQGKMYVMGGGKVVPISSNDAEGLIVWGDENETATEVLLTGNRIRNSGTTTAVIKAVSFCSVTGDIILNNSQASQRESLFVSPLGKSTMIAITGNVFQGAPIIPDYWLKFNSISP